METNPQEKQQDLGTAYCVKFVKKPFLRNKHSWCSNPMHKNDKGNYECSVHGEAINNGCGSYQCLNDDTGEINCAGKCSNSIKNKN
jgi:hypothetical protein